MSFNELLLIGNSMVGIGFMFLLGYIISSRDLWKRTLEDCERERLILMEEVRYLRGKIKEGHERP